MPQIDSDQRGEAADGDGQHTQHPRPGRLAMAPAGTSAGSRAPHREKGRAGPSVPVPPPPPIYPASASCSFRPLPHRRGGGRIGRARVAVSVSLTRASEATVRAACRRLQRVGLGSGRRGIATAPTRRMCSAGCFCGVRA